MNEENQTPALDNTPAAETADTPDAGSGIQPPAPAQPESPVSAVQEPVQAEVFAAEQPQSFIPVPEGYAPAPSPKKRSLLWLWITLPVLAVALIVLILFLCLKPGAPNFKNAPQAYLSAAIGNTGSAIAESFEESPFAAIGASCEGLNDVHITIDFLLDLSEMGSNSIGISLDETVNLTQKALLAHMGLTSNGQSMEISAYSDETDMLLQLGNEGWKGFGLQSFQEELENSIFAPGSGSYFELSRTDVAEALEMITMMQSFWEVAGTQSPAAPAAEGSPFMDTLFAALPQPEIGKSDFSFAGSSKSYDSYTYHLASEDLIRLSAAFWDAVDADPAWSAFFNTVFTAEDLAGFRNEPVSVDADDFLDLTIAFHNNKIAAATLANDDGSMELLLGENPAHATDMSFTISSDDEAITLSRAVRYPSGSEGFSDVFSLSFYEYGEEQMLSFSTEWNKKSGDMTLAIGANIDGTPLEIALNGALQAGAKGKGFQCDIDELSFKIFALKQSLPLTFSLGVEAGQPIDKPAQWEKLFSMTEDEVYDWLDAFAAASSFVNYV